MMVEHAKFAVTSGSPEQTQALGKCLAHGLRVGDLLALEGQLGAGKTCFVQGLAEGLGVRGRVASPTFIVMRQHPGEIPLFHADAYRLGSAEELEDVGLEDWLGEGVVAIEWADQVLEALPPDYLVIEISGEDDTRLLTFSANGPRSTELVEHLSTCVS
ncbi:MAG: tRNA (adenosine(37)-N6)-threonylcarbamoyltransferase complex ATPase subunit type 1 TsaE [Armatimonadota bacterium]